MTVRVTVRHYPAIREVHVDGADRSEVEAEAARMKAKIDPYRSPHFDILQVGELDPKWRAVLRFYGLD